MFGWKLVKDEDKVTLEDVNQEMLERLQDAHSKIQEDAVEMDRISEAVAVAPTDEDDVVMPARNKADMDYYKSTLDGVEVTTKLLNEKSDSERRFASGLFGTIGGGLLALGGMAFLDHCERRGEDDVATEPTRHPGFKFIPTRFGK